MKRRVFLCLLSLCLLLLLCSGCGSRSIVGAWKGDAAKTLADSYNFRMANGESISIAVDFVAVFYEDGTGKLADTSGYAADVKWSMDEDGQLILSIANMVKLTCACEVTGSSLTLTPVDTELPIIMRKATAEEREAAENARSWMR